MNPTDAPADAPISAEIPEEWLREGLAKNELTATDQQITLLHQYLTELLRVNTEMNLTAVREPRDAIVKHIVDSAKVTPYIPANATLLDVGSGAGLPAFPIAILRPDVTVTTLDSTRKKSDFIAQTAEKLNLPNLTARYGRAETLGHDEALRGRFSTVTARAVARLNLLCELCMPFLKKGDGTFLAMKSRLTEEETQEARRAITALGGKLDSVKYFTLTPLNADEPLDRSVVIIRKTASTPARYPRPYAQMVKAPL